MADRPPIAPHQLTANVKLLQKAVLIHRGEVLLLQREPNDVSRPSCWDTPGGNSEWPEKSVAPLDNPHLADIVREIQEESSIMIDPSSLTHEFLAYHETYYEPAREVFTVLFGWRIELPETFDRDQVAISHEHQAAQWVTPQQAQDFDFGGPKGDFMKKIIAAATAHL